MAGWEIDKTVVTGIKSRDGHPVPTYKHAFRRAISMKSRCHKCLHVMDIGRSCLGHERVNDATGVLVSCSGFQQYIEHRSLLPSLTSSWAAK